MWGVNWVDLIIIAAIGFAIFHGIRAGMMVQLCTIVGCFGGLLLSSLIVPHVLFAHDQTTRVSLNASFVLVIAGSCGLLGYWAGHSIHWNFRIGRLKKHQNYKFVETILGALPALVAGLAIAGLIGVGISRLPFEGLSNSVADSKIIQTMTDHLPPIPEVFATLGNTINANDEPVVYIRPRPFADFNYASSDVDLAAAKAQSGVVRITSFGCGGLVSGSGFVAAKHYVMTNAHVIAGVKRPIVKINGQSYEGIPVYFNATTDIAVLRVSGLPQKGLALNSGSVPLDSTVAILGFPGGNYRTTPGIIRDTLAVSASTIYDVGSVGRGVYVTQATVESGNSGGPLVLKDGTVAGMLFSRSTVKSDEAYAITATELVKALTQAQKNTNRVSTGACLAN